MEGAAVDEDALFSTIEASGARALLIGRRAMIVLGIPVMTANCDLWLHVDDVERLNAAMEAIDHHPSVPADEARRRERYVLENDEHIDVMVTRSATTKTGAVLAFDDAWARRQTVAYGSVTIAVPSVADLLSVAVSARQKLAPEVQAIWEERLAPEVFAERVRAALAETEEIAHQAELIAWFSRRYPTAKQRLAYARRKYAEFTRAPSGVGSASRPR